jgi:hypothetical protein
MCRLDPPQPLVHHQPQPPSKSPPPSAPTNPSCTTNLRLCHRRARRAQPAPKTLSFSPHIRHQRLRPAALSPSTMRSLAIIYPSSAVVAATNGPCQVSHTRLGGVHSAKLRHLKRQCIAFTPKLKMTTLRTGPAASHTREAGLDNVMHVGSPARPAEQPIGLDLSTGIEDDAMQGARTCQLLQK